MYIDVDIFFIYIYINKKKSRRKVPVTFSHRGVYAFIVNLLRWATSTHTDDTLQLP